MHASAGTLLLLYDWNSYLHAFHWKFFNSNGSRHWTEGKTWKAACQVEPMSAYNILGFHQHTSSRNTCRYTCSMRIEFHEQDLCGARHVLRHVLGRGCIENHRCHNSMSLTQLHALRMYDYAYAYSQAPARVCRQLFDTCITWVLLSADMSFSHHFSS